jgi:NADPH-dependent F420 reductase
MTTIGVLGGTGIEGKGLALRLAAAGVPVLIGSRSSERACALARECNSILRTDVIRGLSNTEMLSLCSIVFLAVRFDQALSALESYGSFFQPGQILVDVTVPVRFEKGQPVQVALPHALSSSELIANHLPNGVSLVGTFKTLPAKLLADAAVSLECDEFICGDSPGAKQAIIDLVQNISGLRMLDVGPLSMAHVLEHMTVLAIQLNRMNKRAGARYKVIGI